MASGQIMSFTLSKKRFDFDYNPTLLTGDQTEIIRRQTGMSAMAFLRAALNITSDNFDERMLLVVAYLAEYRSNDLLEWEAFIRTVSPFDVEWIAEPADAEGKDAGSPTGNKSGNRARGRSVAHSASSG